MRAQRSVDSGNNNSKKITKLTTLMKPSKTILSRYYRMKKHKRKYLRERGELNKIFCKNKNDLLEFDINKLKTIAKCDAQVPSIKGEGGRYDPNYRRCTCPVLWLGHDRCYNHSTKFLSRLLQPGQALYKEIAAPDGNKICDPNSYIQVKYD